MDTKTNRKMVDSGVEWIGEMPEGWSLQRLGSISSAKNGDWGEEPSGSDKGVICYRKADYSGSFIFEGSTRRVSKRKPFVGYGDTIVEKSGGGDASPVGMPALVLNHEPAICSNFMMRVRASDSTSPTYLFYSVLAMYGSSEIYNLFNQTTGIQNLNTPKFMATAFLHPPLPLQQAIANYLDHHVGLIDEERNLISKKIELLKEKRSTLIFEVVTGKRTLVEAQHLAGVDDWSDAVGSGELMAVPAPRGDDPFVKSGRLVDSGVEWIGEMPEGWTVKPLRSLAKITNGGTPTSEAMFWDGGIAWATPADFRNGETLYETTRTLTPEGIRKAGSMMPIGTILVSCRAPVGKVCMVGAPVSFNQGCKGIAPISEMNNRYVFYSLQASAKEMEIVSSGTTFMEISTSSLGKIAYPCPPLPTQQSIADFLDFETGLIDKEIDLLTQKNELLSEQRKALIFEAVTGKIEITE